VIEPVNPPANKQDGVIDVKMAEPEKQGIKENGKWVELSVRLKTAPGAKPLESVVGSKSVFYIKDGDKIAIETGSSQVFPGYGKAFDIVVSLPPKPHIRYPTLPALPKVPGIDKLRLQAVIEPGEIADNSPQITLNSGQGWTHQGPKDGKERYVTKITLNAPSDAALKKKLDEKLAKGLKVKLTLGGQSLPETKKDITIK
jgi:hypothetical protein